MSSKVEAWKPILIDGRKPSVPYMISNRGRFGVLLKNGKLEVRTFKASGGYYRYNIRHRGKNKAIFLFKEVAQAFLKKPSSAHKLVIHKDHNYLNDKVENLRWATASEHRLHAAQSPNSKKARQERAISTSSHNKVLNEKSVRALKAMIWDPKRKLSLKQIAAKHGVSEMQIYRIKKGEFWFHVHVENEPLHAKYKQNLRNLKGKSKDNTAVLKTDQKIPVKNKKQIKGSQKKPIPVENIPELGEEKKRQKKDKHHKGKKHKHKKHKKKHKKKDRKKKHKKHKQKKH